MSIWGTIKKGVTGPFRAIGDLAQLKIRKAVGDLADTGKLAIPVAAAAIPGLGVPAVVAMGAAEGAADQWGHGENNIGKIALGAGKGAATATAAKAVGGFFRGGVPVPGGGAESVVGSATGDAGGALSTAGDVGGDDFLASIAANGGTSAPASVAPAVSSVVPNLPAPGGPAGKFQMPGSFKDIGKFAKKNPAIVAQAAGSALDTFAGANTDSRRLDIQAEQVANQKESDDRRAKLEELMAMMQGYSNFRPRF